MASRGDARCADDVRVHARLVVRAGTNHAGRLIALVLRVRGMAGGPLGAGDRSFAAGTGGAGCGVGQGPPVSAVAMARPARGDRVSTCRKPETWEPGFSGPRWSNGPSAAVAEALEGSISPIDWTAAAAAFGDPADAPCWRPPLLFAVDLPQEIVLDLGPALADWDRTSAGRATRLSRSWGFADGRLIVPRGEPATAADSGPGPPHADRTRSGSASPVPISRRSRRRWSNSPPAISASSCARSVSRLTAEI